MAENYVNDVRLSFLKSYLISVIYLFQPSIEAVWATVIILILEISHIEEIKVLPTNFKHTAFSCRDFEILKVTIRQPQNVGEFNMDSFQPLKN